MPPGGGPCSAQVLKSCSPSKGGMSYPLLAATVCSTEERWQRWVKRLFAADLFGENFQVPQKNGTAASKRPFGPFGDGKCQTCSATLGASRTATAQAEGGLKISVPWPEIRYLLFEESSQAKASFGINGTSFLNHSITCRVASDLTVMLPSLSTKAAPWLRITGSVQATESLVTPRPTPTR